MPSGIRTVSLALLAGSALVLAAALPAPFGVLGSEPAMAQGNGGGHGGGNGGGGGNSGGGGGSSHSNNGGGSSASANTHSSWGHSHTNTAQNQSRSRNSYAYSGSQGGSGVPKAIIRQYVLATGLTQGDVARTLKSWNSLNRNPRAFAATLNNPKSLPALQVAYIRDNMLAEQQLAAFTALGGDAANPPTAQQYQDAQAYLSAQSLLDTNGVTAAEVLAAPAGTYSSDVVAAATTVSGYTGPDAQTVVSQYDAWTAYQSAAATATDAFAAASVSDRNADPATLDALRKLVDDIIKTEGLDTMVSSL